MASITFLLVLVIRELFCDNRIIGVFEEDEPGEEGWSHSSDHLIPYSKLTGQRHFNSIWESERRWKLCPVSPAGVSVTGLNSRVLCQHDFGSHPNPSFNDRICCSQKGKPVRACTPTHTHVCTVDSQQGPWKTRMFTYQPTMEKPKDGIERERKSETALSSLVGSNVPQLHLSRGPFSTQRGETFHFGDMVEYTSKTFQIITHPRCS